MSQRSGTPRSSERSRSLYRFVDMVREREVSEETEPTMDSEQPSQQEEEEVESEPMEDPSNGDEARSVASSQMVRRSPPPPPSPPAPRAPPPRQNVAMNASDGRFPTHDPYIHPRPPRHHPHQFGPRHGEGLPRPVYGIPPPPRLGMTREERDRMWGIASGLRDARVRVRSQEIMMERAFGIMRQSRDEAGMALDGMYRVNEVVFMIGCVLAALCALVVAYMIRK